MRPSPSPQRRPANQTFAKILMTVAFVGGFALFFVWATNETTPASEGSAQANPGEPWPSVPATFTPVPTAPTIVIPNPTPIPLPPPQIVSEWAVLKFTLASNQTARGTDQNKIRDMFGQDAVSIRVVGRVTVGFPVDLIETQLITESSGRAITMQLPALQVTSVEILLDQSALISVSKRRWFSEYPGLELQAIRMGRDDIYNQVANNPEMLALATDVARLKVADHLRSLGFTDITITTTNPTQGGQ